jgi:hypothetical protein
VVCGESRDWWQDLIRPPGWIGSSWSRSANKKPRRLPRSVGESFFDERWD